MYTTGAQEWHIVSLLGDVTSPTSAVHYVSMTSDIRVLSTEKHCPVRRQHTVYINKSLQCKGKYIVCHWRSREASLRHSSGWGTCSVSPQYRDLRTRGVHPLHNMWPPSHSTSILQVFIICEVFSSKVLPHFWKQEKKFNRARSGLYGGCSKMSQWNCSISKACVCRAVAYADVQQNNSTRELASSAR